jgi:hypothetical protein
MPYAYAPLKERGAGGALLSMDHPPIAADDHSGSSSVDEA